ncbi:hypothetical protein [Terriglobus albidus]|uniref:hypothetical protein n=1 Tax=Terriglobus albidus TaxID=1592106 RepID=UPI0021DF4CAF|nr:hypothetical protein [Terriglobus albidus]
MADSIKKQIRQALMARLYAAGAPAGITSDTVLAQRTRPKAITSLPSYSIFFAHEADPKPVGHPRQPVRLDRVMTIVVRIAVVGEDDAIDVHEQWVVKQLASAWRLVSAQYQHGLIMSITEGASKWNAVEDASATITELDKQWHVEYSTLPDDITKTGRD